MSLSATSNRRFHISKEKRGDIDVLRFSGTFDEEAGVQLIQLYDNVGKKCVFNFAGVTGINSKGTRAWMMFLRDFINGHEVEMEECSPVTVEQANMLPSFFGKARVRSVFVPFVCEGCQNVENFLIKEPEFLRGKETGLKPVRCRSCSGEMKQEQTGYFDFFKTRP